LFRPNSDPGHREERADFIVKLAEPVEEVTFELLEVLGRACQSQPSVKINAQAGFAHVTGRETGLNGFHLHETTGRMLGVAQRRIAVLVFAVLPEAGLPRPQKRSPTSRSRGGGGLFLA
jgi:hypothetical protein